PPPSLACSTKQLCSGSNLRDPFATTGKNLMHHGLESLARSWWYEGVLAARYNQYSTINVRARCESSCSDTSTEFYIKPHPPLGGHHGCSAKTCSATGHPPLDEQDSVLPTWRPKNATQYRGRKMNWQNSHQHVWNMMKSKEQEVVVLDLNLLTDPLL